jgi:hypothetical protein
MCQGILSGLMTKIKKKIAHNMLELLRKNFARIDKTSLILIDIITGFTLELGPALTSIPNSLMLLDT